MRTSAVDVHHGIARFAWRLTLPDGSSLPEGLDIAFLDPDQRRISRIIRVLSASSRRHSPDIPPVRAAAATGRRGTLFRKSRPSRSSFRLTPAAGDFSSPPAGWLSPTKAALILRHHFWR